MVPSERGCRLPGRDRERVAPRARSTLLAVAALWALAASAAETAGEIAWKAAFQTAKEQQRLVFVDYYATWCGPCKVMDEQVFVRGDVKEQMAKFVVLRVDVDRSVEARAHAVHVLPTYAVYDPGEREIIRMLGAKAAVTFRDALTQLDGEKERFLRASSLYDAGNDLEGAFTSANAFMRLRLTNEARDALDKARKTAEKEGKTSAAQIAAIQQAATFSIEGKPKKSIKLLEQIAQSPVNRDTEAVAWLTLGDVQRMAKNTEAARQAYQHVIKVAPTESQAYQSATAALTKVQ